MQESIFEAGWVYKQSGMFKHQSKAWMVLSPEGLFTYNKEGDTTQMNKLDLSDIKSIEKKCESSFLVHTSVNSHSFSTDNNADVWVSAIHRLLRSPSDSSEQFLAGAFSRLIGALQARELELLSENERLVLHQKSLGKSYLASLSVQESELEEVSELISRTASEPLTSRIKQIKGISIDPSKEEMPFKMKVEFNSQTSHVHDLVDKFTNVSCANPNDLTVKRSNITRALKWRYTGDKVDALSFVVNHDVSLYSIGFCTPYKHGGKIHVRKLLVLMGKSTDCKPIYIHKEQTCLTYELGKPVKQIRLSNPLTLKKEQAYTVYFLVEGEPSFKCVDCLALATAGEVEWRFFNTEFTAGHYSNRTDSVCGPIANFQFQKIK